VLIGAEYAVDPGGDFLRQHPGDERRFCAPEYRQKLPSRFTAHRQVLGGLSGVKVASRVEREVAQ